MLNGHLSNHTKIPNTVKGKLYIWFNRFCTLKIIQHNGPGGDKCDVLSETFIYADVNESYDVKCKYSYSYEHFRLVFYSFIFYSFYGFCLKLISHLYHLHSCTYDLLPPRSLRGQLSNYSIQDAWTFHPDFETKKLCIPSYGVLLFGDALCIPRSIVILQNYDLTAILAQPREFSAHYKLL